MRNTIFLTFATAVLVFTMVACGDDPGGNNPGDETTWTVSFDPSGTDVTLTSAATIPAIQVAKGKSATAAGVTWPSSPTSSTHDFGGWYKTTDTAQTTAITTTTVINEDLSLKAKWTAKPPPLSSAPVKVGATTQDVSVTASTESEVTYITNGYQVVISDYGEYAWFKVNLGAGKKLSNFMQVKFNFNAIKGDIGYKTYFLLISDSEFPASLNGESDEIYEPLTVSGFRWWQGTGTKAVTCVLGEVETENAGSPNSVGTNVAKSTANEVYVCLYVHAAGTGDNGGTGVATTYSIANIEFVPAPEYLAVSGINGVPDVGEISKEVDLTKASVTPAAATNKTIVWSLTDAGTTGVTAITAGKFTPTAVGTIKVTVTIENGLTATTPFTREFEIAIRSVPTDKQIALTGTMSGGCTGTLDGDGFGFTVTAGANYEHTAAIFALNLGSATLKDVVKVTFDYTPVSGDTNYKPIDFIAGATGALVTPFEDRLGTVETGNTTVNTAKSLEIVLDYTKAKAITGPTIDVGFVVRAGSTANFKISNIKFWVAE